MDLHPLVPFHCMIEQGNVCCLMHVVTGQTVDLNREGFQTAKRLPLTSRALLALR